MVLWRIGFQMSILRMLFSILRDLRCSSLPLTVESLAFSLPMGVMDNCEGSTTLDGEIAR